MNKRGLSQVVTTVILILVVLAAIVIIWAAVRPTIERTTEQFTTDCFALELEARACSASANTVTVNRGSASGDLTGIVFVFNDGTTETVSDTTTTMPGPLESLPIVLQRDITNGEIVNVAAVIGQGNVCPESSNAPATCS